MTEAGAPLEVEPAAETADDDVADGVAVTETGAEPASCVGDPEHPAAASKTRELNQLI